MKTAVGGYSHIFVAIDKFTKWIEVKPVTTTIVAKAAKFIEEISHLLMQKSTHWNPRASVCRVTESQPSVPVNLT